MLVKIYTDGAARGNPDGPGGYGTVLEYVDTKGQLHKKELSQGYEKTTNNRMELMAVIAGLEALNRSCEVEVYSDSQYVVNAFNQHWVDGWIKKGWKRGKNEPVKNVDLWKRLLEAKQKHSVTFHWVKGHDGHPQNERCDELATTAADGTLQMNLVTRWNLTLTGSLRTRSHRKIQHRLTFLFLLWRSSQFRKSRQSSLISLRILLTVSRCAIKLRTLIS